MQRRDATDVDDDWQFTKEYVDSPLSVCMAKDP